LKQGFVYAATGDAGYTELAIRSAISLKAQCPDYPIDLYTDKPVDHDVFDQVHVYQDSWFRAKIDALKDSRFDQTVYIDADTFVVDDISDIFYLFDRYDVALTHDQGRNSSHSKEFYQTDFPQSFPTFNGGLLAVNNKNPKVLALLTEWKEVIQSTNTKKDQPSLRELLWRSHLQIGVLPPEYNIMHLHWLDSINLRHATPKVIHSPKLHRHFKSKGEKITTLYQLLGYRRLGKVLHNLSHNSCSKAKNIPEELLFGKQNEIKFLDKIKIKKIRKMLN